MHGHDIEWHCTFIFNCKQNIGRLGFRVSCSSENAHNSITNIGKLIIAQ